MAAVNKIDMSGLILDDNVVSKPPMPLRPTSGKFHNRGSGKLFPTTYQNKFFSEKGHSQVVVENGSNEENSMALVVHPAFMDDNKNNSNCNTNTPRHVPSYCRRTKSAKAKINSRSDKSRSLSARPLSAGNKPRSRSNVESLNNSDNKQVPVIDLAEKVVPDLCEIEKEHLLALPCPKYFHKQVVKEMPPMHFATEAKYGHDFYDDFIPKKGRNAGNADTGLKPSVYSLQHQRQVYGSASDITQLAADCHQFPGYKFSTCTKDCHKNGSEDNSTSSIPSTLEPLLPWLRDDVPTEVTGLSPTTSCLVFLSATDWSSLPEVPEPVKEDDDLPFVEDITTPKPWKPKKYSHPFYDREPVEEWVCKHKSQGTDASSTQDDWCRQSVKIPRMRTADVVRKEIKELTNLLQGIGCGESDCGMVKYQSEITEFRHNLQVTLDMVPDRLKNPPPPSPDRFGLKKVCSDHDVIIKKIQERMSRCHRELAQLEVDAGISTDRQHFRKRSNSVV